MAQWKRSPLTKWIACGCMMVLLLFCGLSALAEEVPIQTVRAAISGRSDQQVRTELSFSQQNYALPYGQNVQLELMGNTENVAQVFWHSSNESLLQVERDGYVRCVGALQSNTAVTVTATVLTWDAQIVTVTGQFTVQGESQEKLNSQSPPQISASQAFLRETLYLYPGERFTLSPTLPVGSKVTRYENSAPGVATLDAQAQIVAVAPGETVITMDVSTSPQQKHQVKVTVLPAFARVSSGPRLTVGAVTLWPGERLRPAYTLPGGMDNAMQWTSDDPSVVSIDAEGTITAVGQGGTLVRMKTADGSYQTAYYVTVPGLELVNPDLTLSADGSESVIQLAEGEQYTIMASIVPRDMKNVAYTTGHDNPKAITLDSLTITALQGGAGETANVMIMAATRQGVVTSTLKVIVVEGTTAATGGGTKQPSSGSSDKRLVINPSTLTLLVGGQYKLKATLLPSGIDADCTYVSSDPRIATVTSDGLVTGIKTGNVTITARTSNGSFQAHCAVSVVMEQETQITLTPSRLTLEQGDLATLTATVVPGSVNQTIEFATSDEKIVSIQRVFENQTVILAEAPGTAIITAKVLPSGKTATCEVTVKVPVTGVIMDPPALFLELGESPKLTATVVPSNATNKGLYWSSSDSEIVSVDSNGQLTLHKTGTVTVTATSKDNPSASDVCRILVVQKRVTALTLPSETRTLTMKIPESIGLDIEPSGVAAEDMGVTVTYEPEGIVLVDYEGGLYPKTWLPQSVGTTKVTFRSQQYPAKTVVCTVTVKYADVYGVRIKPESIQSSYVAGVTPNQQPVAETYAEHPLGVTDPNTPISWFSRTSTDHIAKFASTAGNLQPLEAGTAYIYAGAAGKTSIPSTPITVVYDEVVGFMVEPASYTFKVGEKTTLTAVPIGKLGGNVGANPAMTIQWPNVPSDDGQFRFVSTGTFTCEVEALTVGSKTYRANATATGVSGLLTSEPFKLTAQWDAGTQLIVEPDPTPASISVLANGTPVQFTAKWKNTNGDVFPVQPGQVTWELEGVNAAAIANIGQDGLLQGLTQGTVHVRASATVGGQTYYANKPEVRVTWASLKEIRIEPDPNLKPSTNPLEADLVAGVDDGTKVKVILIGDGGDPDPNIQITWHSTDEGIAKVNNDRSAHGFKAGDPDGTAFAYVYASSGSLSSNQVKLVVSWDAVAGVDVKPESRKVVVNDSVVFTATLRGEKGGTINPNHGYTIRWPDNASYVDRFTMSPSGDTMSCTFTALSETTEKFFTATAEKLGSTPFTSNFFEIEATHGTITGIDLSETTISVVADGAPLQLDAWWVTQSGEQATSSTFTWSSDNTNIVTVDQTGLVQGVYNGIDVVANSPAQITVTGTTPDGATYSKTCAVYVTWGEVTKITIDPSSIPTGVIRGVDPNAKLTYTLETSGTINPATLFVWSSTPAGLVDQDGNVSALTQNTSITVTVQNGGTEPSDTIVIQPAYDKIIGLRVTPVSDNEMYVTQSRDFQVTFVTEQGGTFDPNHGLTVSWPPSDAYFDIAPRNNGMECTMTAKSATPAGGEPYQVWITNSVPVIDSNTFKVIANYDPPRAAIPVTVNPNGSPPIVLYRNGSSMLFSSELHTEHGLPSAPATLRWIVSEAYLEVVDQSTGEIRGTQVTPSASSAYVQAEWTVEGVKYLSAQIPVEVKWALVKAVEFIPGTLPQAPHTAGVSPADNIEVRLVTDDGDPDPATVISWNLQYASSVADPSTIVPVSGLSTSAKLTINDGGTFTITVTASGAPTPAIHTMTVAWAKIGNIQVTPEVNVMLVGDSTLLTAQLIADPTNGRMDPNQTASIVWPGNDGYFEFTPSGDTLTCSVKAIDTHADDYTARLTLAGGVEVSSTFRLEAGYSKIVGLVITDDGNTLTAGGTARKYFTAHWNTGTPFAPGVSNVEWFSADPLVVEIDRYTGVARGLRASSTGVNIYATAEYGGQTYTSNSIPVTVGLSDVQSVAINPGSEPADPVARTNTTYNAMTYTVTTTDGGQWNDVGLTPTWTSHDLTVATVDPATGTLTLKSGGTAKISVTIDGKQSPIYEFTVNYAPLYSISVTPNSQTLSVGSTGSTLTATLYAQGDGVLDPAAVNTILWPRTEDNNYFQFTSAGNTCDPTALHATPGIQTFTVSVQGTSVQTTFTLSATGASITITPPISMVNNTLYVGSTANMVFGATWSPDGGSTAPTGPITWETSNTSIATIDRNNGTLTIAAAPAPSALPYTLTVTAMGTLNNGQPVSSTYDVIIDYAPPDTVVITSNSGSTSPVELVLGTTLNNQLQATISSSLGTVRPGLQIEWTSGGSHVSVTNAGVLTPVAYSFPAQTTVKATVSGYPGAFSTVGVTVDYDEIVSIVITSPIHILHNNKQQITMNVTTKNNGAYGQITWNVGNSPAVAEIVDGTTNSAVCHVFAKELDALTASAQTWIQVGIIGQNGVEVPSNKATIIVDKTTPAPVPFMAVLPMIAMVDDLSDLMPKDTQKDGTEVVDLLEDEVTEDADLIEETENEPEENPEGPTDEEEGPQIIDLEDGNKDDDATEIVVEPEEEEEEPEDIVENEVVVHSVAWASFPSEALIAGTGSVKASVTLTQLEGTEVPVRRVVYESSNPDVASITSGGSIKPVSAGTTIITARVAQDGGWVSAESKELTVRWDTVSEISLTPANLSMTVGAEETFATTYTTAHGGRISDDFTISTLSTDDPEVVMVDGLKVKAIDIGTTTVRVRAQSGDTTLDAECVVTVTAAPVTDPVAEAQVIVPDDTQATTTASHFSIAPVEEQPVTSSTNGSQTAGDNSGGSSSGGSSSSSGSGGAGSGSGTGAGGTTGSGNDTGPVVVDSAWWDEGSSSTGGSSSSSGSQSPSTPVTTPQATPSTPVQDDAWWVTPDASSGSGNKWDDFWGQ